ncbi:WecB/TagA/CpsF family glycosyltransferase [Candidatus Uhrbacteria bacterium]|nr:WecB/TagA/CpsF family glycosyltransferase [Candidatus Uhrbacteria bacterium]
MGINEQSVALLGVGLESITRQEVGGRLFGFLQGTKAALVVTPNPEMLVLAEKDPHFRKVLNSADLRLVDGFGLVLAAFLLGKKLVRFSGVDALHTLARQSARGGKRLLLVGGMHNEDAPRAAENLARMYPGLLARGVGGGPITMDGEVWSGGEEIIRTIHEWQPHILAVSLGHGKQERWLAEHLKSFSSVRVGIGIGGALEFLSGRQTRAPRWMRAFGLEWMYRLLCEPRRFRRIYHAVILFPILVIRSTLRSI